MMVPKIMGQDHMYGPSAPLMVPPSSAVFRKVRPARRMYAFEIHSKSFRDLIEIQRQSSLNENALLAAKKQTSRHIE